MNKPIKISFTKQIDGYTFSLLPSVREEIRSLFTDASPANLIFVGFDTGSNFETNFSRLCNQVFPMLLGINSKVDLKKIPQLEYISSETNESFKISPSIIFN